MTRQELDSAEKWLKSRLSENQLKNLDAIQKIWNISSSSFNEWYDDISKSIKCTGAIFFITESTNCVLHLKCLQI